MLKIGDWLTRHTCSYNLKWTFESVTCFLPFLSLSVSQSVSQFTLPFKVLSFCPKHGRPFVWAGVRSHFVMWVNRATVVGGVFIIAKLELSQDHGSNETKKRENVDKEKGYIQWKVNKKTWVFIKSHLFPLCISILVEHNQKSVRIPWNERWNKACRNKLLISGSAILSTRWCWSSQIPSPQ